MEKSDIHHFIQRCIQRLKGSDRKLPQVVKLTELLKRGIGVHHSGVLPILKEVVEMLFQRGWVKLLFATETFAMGVNMPARTVVFDNIRKHDGMSFRTLLPAEYIQMAGRAGRRGLDSTGTVIILCKNEVFEMSSLVGMMQGKPQRLESQFRLTYSMILNLLRVEKLRVEDMMKRSFKEVDSQKKMESVKKRLALARKELETFPKLPSGPSSERVELFHSLASQYLELKESNWSLILNQPNAVKLLSPGRLLVVLDGASGVVKLVILAAVDSTSREKSFSVLALRSDKPSENTDLDLKFSRLTSVSGRVDRCYSTDEGPYLLNILEKDILEISTKTIKFETDKIVNDLKRRELPRFKNDPMGQSTAFAVQELIKFSDLAVEGKFETVDLAKDLKVQGIDLQSVLMQMRSLKENPCILESRAIPDFKEQLTRVHKRASLVAEIEDLEFLCSEASLEHLPEYHQHIDVLKRDVVTTIVQRSNILCSVKNLRIFLPNSAEQVVRLHHFIRHAIANLHNCRKLGLLQQRKTGLAISMPTAPSSLRDASHAKWVVRN